MFKLYPRLAWQNLRKNYRVTAPYLLRSEERRVGKEC